MAEKKPNWISKKILAVPNVGTKPYARIGWIVSENGYKNYN